MDSFNDFYLLRSVVLSLSLWHTKTPHFLNSIPYCLTNGVQFNPAVELSYLDESQQRDFLEAMADTQNAPSLSQAQRLKKLAQEGHFSYDVAFAVMGEPKKDELDKVVIKNDTLRKYFPESSTPREMEEKIIGLLEESKTEKVVFRSDSIKKYFPSNYSSEQIENSILKMLDQRMKKRKHEAER